MEKSESMDIQQLLYFRTLAETEHMTQSAEKLLISQSALSRSIARLEDELGVPLFERQGRAIHLNAYGVIFLRRVEKMIQEYVEAKQEIQDLIQPHTGTISLGFLHTLSTNIIPDMISQFRDSYPETHFRLSQGASHVMLEQLYNGQIDLCFIAPNEKNDQVGWMKLWEEELFAVVPKNHRLAKKNSITLEELKYEPIIHLKKGYSLRETVEGLFLDAGITPKITFEGDEADTVAGLVAAELGVSVLPDLKGINKSKIIQIPISRPHCFRMIGIAWLESRYMSPITKTFKKFVTDQYVSSGW